MLICLWKGCEHVVFVEENEFQDHVNQHAKEQIQSDIDILSNKQGADTTEEEEPPMAKIAKMNVARVKMPTQFGRRVVCKAIEIWMDVRGFIKIIHLARTVNLAKRLLHQICWPCMDSGIREISIGCRDEFNGRLQTTLVLNDGTEMPLASWPRPHYCKIYSVKINYLDQEVLNLLAYIYSRMAVKTRIYMLLILKELNEKQRAFVGQLLDCFCQKSQLEINLHTNYSMANIQMLQDLDNKMRQVKSVVVSDKSDIPIVIKMLKTPRSDGQQRAMRLVFRKCPPLEMVYAIKEEFRASTQSLPQPFYIRISRFSLEFVDIDEENQQTGETLHSFDQTYMNGCIETNIYWDICWHPKGQHAKLAEDGKNKLKSMPTNLTVHVEF